MRKATVLLIMLMLISGCATIEKGSYIAVSGQARLVKVYDYPYVDVYNSIVNTLEKRLRLGISRNYTTEDTIFSTFAVGGSVFGSGYMYLFTLKSIDEDHTEVTLKSKGGLTSVSNNDMLNKYVSEELKYYKIKK